MSTITDLRDTLERHAADVVDTGVADRVGAVRGQVRVARQRRAAAAVTAAVVALGGTVAAVGLGDEPGAPQPAAELGGHPVPAELTSLGYTYAYTEGAAGAARATLRLPASDRPRLVSWATSDDGLELAGPGHEVWSSTATDFDDFTFVAAGEHPTFRAYGDDAALAVYELTGAAPEGVTRGGVTFRQQVAGQELLGATIGDPGAARVSAGLDEAATGRLSVAVLCTGGDDGVWIHLETDGLPAASFGPGCTDDAFDPGAAAADTREAPPGGLDTVRLWATDGEDGPLVRDPDLRLGVAVYSAPESSRAVAGQPVASLVEADGHTWQLVDLRAAAPGQRQVTVEAPGEDVFVRALVTGTPVTTSGVAVQGHRVVERFSGGDGVVADIGVLRDGSPPLSLRLRGDAGDGARLALATYSKLG